MPRCKGPRSAPRGWTFGPGGSTPGNYTFSVGTAGSATLVLQTVLPALLAGRGRVEPDPRRRHAQSVGPALGFPGEELSPAGQPDGADGRGPTASDPGFIRRVAGDWPFAFGPRGNSGGWNSRSGAKSLPAGCGPWWRTCRGTSPSGSAGRIAEKTGWDEGCFTVEEVHGLARAGQRRNDRVGGGACHGSFHRFRPVGREGRRGGHARARRGPRVPGRRRAGGQAPGRSTHASAGASASIWAREAASSARWRSRGTARRTWRLFATSWASRPKSVRKRTRRA